MQDFAAPPTPAPALPPAPRVRVVARDGRVFEGDESQARALLEQRDPGTGAALFTLDTPEAALERQRQREHGNRPVAAGLAGVARGATLGLSDLALSETGAVSGETLRELAERNALASGAGELTGAVAPLLFSGGGGGLVRAGVEGATLAREGAAGRGIISQVLRGVTAPTRGLTAAAEAAEAGTLAALGTARSESLAARALGRAASMGAGGAVEGAGLGIQQSITESVFHDRELTAQQVLANAGINALLGGAAGGVLGVGIEGLSTATRGVRDVVSRAFREATGHDLRRGVSELWSQGADAVASGSALATGADPALLSRALGPDGSDLRQLVSRGDALFEESGRELTAAMTRAESGTRHVSDLWGAGMKREQLRGLMDTARVGDQFRTAATHVSAIRDLAESVISDARAGATFEAAGIGNRARQLLADVGAAEQMIAAASGRDPVTGRIRRMGDAAEVSASLFSALDQLKRGVGDIQSSVERVDPGSAFLQRLRGTDGYEGIRRTLEDGALWGEGAAGAQREINAAFTRYLERRGRYVREFLGDGARDMVDPFRRLPEADSARVDSFLRAAGTARNDTRARTFREVLEAQAELADVMARHLDLGDLAPEAVAAASNARRARETFDALEDRVARVNQFRALEQGSGVERTLLAQGAGFVLGGPVGAALATALASPTVLARGLGAIERAAARVSTRIDRGASAYVRRALDVARDASRRGVRVADAARRQAMVRVSAEAFNDEVRRVLDAAARPDETNARIAESTRDLGAVAPEIQAQIQAQTQRGLAFLVSRIPASARPAVGVMPGAESMREASTPERARFMRYARAVNDPLSALDDLAIGSIPPESVEVLRELFPRVHQQIGNAFVAEITRRMRGGDRLPFTFRRDLGSLLGAPTDTSLRPEAVAFYQAPPQVASPQPSRNGLGSGDDLMTTTAAREAARGG